MARGMMLREDVWTFIAAGAYSQRPRAPSQMNGEYRSRPAIRGLHELPASPLNRARNILATRLL
jgi:hypothetical protein